MHHLGLILGSVETHFQGRGRIREILELAGLLLVAGGRGGLGLLLLLGLGRLVV